MKKFTNFPVIMLAALLVSALAFTSCMEQLNKYEKCNQSNTPNNQNYDYTNPGNIMGKVVTNNNTPVSGIQVTAGSSVTYTNSKGEFYLSGVPSGNRIKVDFSSTVYTSTQKITAVKPGRTSYIDAAVIAIGTKQNLNATSGGAVNFNGARVDFPANSIVDSKGTAYTGTAQVQATYFDPTTQTFIGCFPGEFSGIRQDNSETMIESFGFISVEIKNGAEKLQLASGKKATITMPIPASIRAKAPNTIPLWYYDEQKGQWLEEGAATKNGNNYVGTVGHFSNWNCDQPTQTSYLEGWVVDSSGTPISFANVYSKGFDYTGQARVQTNDSGYFKLPVKSNATATVWASYFIFTSATQNISTPATQQVQNIGNLVINIDTTNICIIVGRLLDNGNQPMPSVYIHLLDSTGKKIDYLLTNSDGRFKFFGELSKSYQLKIMTCSYDSSNTDTTIYITCPGQRETVDLGDIRLNVGGSTIIGRVIDSSNNPLKNIYINTMESCSSNQRDKSTDSTGRFSLWVRPNITFDIRLYNKGVSKTVSVTSGALGETKDIGDITIP